jgi:hypothetical protein
MVYYRNNVQHSENDSCKSFSCQKYCRWNTNASLNSGILTLRREEKEA